ncbi:MAG: Sir2 family NAD-dependent protein deacetylase, partial [Bacteroidota bacterium]
LVDDFTLITQNVDNLHQRAGSRNVIELHGNITRSYCIDCHRTAPAPGGEAVELCEACGGFIRPDVVWFGEMLPEGAMERADAAARRAEVFLSIGTSGVVYPAAGIPLLAADHGAYTAEINLEPSALAAYMDETVEGMAGEILPALVRDVADAGARAVP